MAGEKKTSGRGVKHEVTPEKRARVLLLRSKGWTLEDIASDLGMGCETLRTRYSVEIGVVDDQAMEEARSRTLDLARKTLDRYHTIITGQHGKLESGETTLLIFGLKCLCGWRETMPVGGDGTREARDYTREELQQLVSDWTRSNRRAAEAGDGTGVATGVR